MLVLHAVVAVENFLSGVTLALAHSDVVTWPTGNGRTEHSSGAGSFS